MLRNQCKNRILERGTWCTHSGSKIDQVMCGNSEHLHCSDTQGRNWYMDCATGASPSTCSPASLFEKIQFPLAYNFPQDDETGVVDRSFNQDAFSSGPSASLSNRKFSLVNPETNMALSVENCNDPGVLVDGIVYNGQFFKFNPENWYAYFGSFQENSEPTIKQCRGSETVGTFEITFIPNGPALPFGRKSTSYSEGDWQRNDYIIKPENDCSSVLKIATNNEKLPSQQFKLTANDQLESIKCPGQVLSVIAKQTEWKCIDATNSEIGSVTLDGSGQPEANICNAKKECKDNKCTIDPTPTEIYSTDGNKVLLKFSSNDDVSQKWRFYHNGIMNLACKREPLFEGMVITQIDDNAFQDLYLFEDIPISIVNNGMALSVGNAVSLKLFT